MPDAPKIPLEDLVVNDRFWLGWARARFSASIASLDSAALRLTSSLAWFWTVYTAVAVLGTSLSDRQFATWQSVLVFLPTVLLVLAYLAATWSSLPVRSDSFDARDPDEARAAYREITRSKQVRIGVSGALTLVAAVGVMFAGAVAAFTGDSAPQTFTVLSTKTIAGEASTTLLIGFIDNEGRAGEWQRSADDEGAVDCWRLAQVGESLPRCAMHATSEFSRH